MSPSASSRILTALALVVTGLPVAASPAGDKIGPALSQTLSALPPEREVAVIVRMIGTADVEDAVRGASGKGRRSARVVRALRGQASRSLARVRPRLERAVGSDAVREMTSLWIINGVALRADAAGIRALAGLEEVARVTLDRVIPLERPLLAQAGEPGWNLEAIGVSSAWDQGLRGQGAVIAVLDSGVDVLHPDLEDSWRGGSDSWFDPYGEFPDTPVDTDPDGHGTGVAGLLVGGEAGGAPVGVAPGAQWIAARVFRDTGAVGTEQSTALLSAIFQSLQWALDPDGDPETDDAPHIVNGSWTFNAPGEFVDPTDASFRDALKALRAAGILPVFAAGNSGQSAATSESPGNYPEALAVGSVTEEGLIPLFSARGPSAFDGVSVYPDLVAPGDAVRTTDKTLQGANADPYAFRSGTSFAAPHVAGGAALLLSANPDLTVLELSLELVSAVEDVGAPGPDNDSGHGRLDLSASRVLRGELPGALAGVSLLADPPGSQSAGAAIAFAATPIDEDSPNEFRFWIAGPSTGGAWRMAREYGDDPTWSWETSAADGGTTRVVVHARRKGSSLNYEAADALDVALVDPALSLWVSADRDSPQLLGEDIVFTAAAQGGTGAFEYRFLLRSPGGGDPQVVQPFSGQDRFLWRTEGVEAGAWGAVVQARHDGSLGEAEAETEVSFELLEPPPIAIDSLGVDLPDRGLCFVQSCRGAPPLAGALLGAVAAALGIAAFRRGRGRAGRRRARRALVVGLGCVVLAGASAARAEEPRWALQLSAGAFLPVDGGWKDVFGSGAAFEGKLGLGYRLGPAWEVGIEAGYRRASDATRVRGPGGSTVEVDREITVVPVQVYLLAQWRGKEEQLLVPYGALGVGRYHYRQDVEDDDRDGYLWSASARAGVKLLLDRLDPGKAERVRRSLGLTRTYALLEAQHARADDFGGSSTDLGGWSFYGGFLFEF